MASCAPKSLSSASSIIAVRYAAAGDDMGATVHLRLRLVRVASIKGRENLVTVAVGQHAGAVNVGGVVAAAAGAAAHDASGWLSGGAAHRMRAWPCPMLMTSTSVSGRMVDIAFTIDGNQRYNWRKNRPSLFVNWIRPRTWG